MTGRRALARTALTAACAAGLALSAVATAQADPKRGDMFDLVCGGTTYQVVTTGNGDYTPAHDVHSNLTFIPHAFAAFHGVIRDDEGAIVDEFVEDASTQGSGKQKNDVSCTFSFHEVSDGSDPEFPEGYTFDGTGSVTGQIAGHA